MRALRRLQNRILKRYGMEGWRLPREAEPPALPPGDKAVLERALRRHRELELELRLNLLDEQIELRRSQFLKIELVDPLRRHARRLDPLRPAYAKVLEFRDAIRRENRLPSSEERDELDRLNAEVETELNRLAAELIVEAGPPVPHDMKVAFRQVSAEDLRKLGKVRRAP